MEAFSESGVSLVSFWPLLHGVTVEFRSVLLSGELGRLGSALSQVLVFELVFGVFVELPPTLPDGVTLELESELTLLKLATGNCSALTF